MVYLYTSYSHSLYPKNDIFEEFFEIIYILNYFKDRNTSIKKNSDKSDDFKQSY